MPAINEAPIEMTFELEVPVTGRGGVVYTTLNARRPKVKDLRILAMGSDKDPVGSYNKFLAGLCTVPPEVIDELDLKTDYKAIQNWVKDFLPKSDE